MRVSVAARFTIQSIDREMYERGGGRGREWGVFEFEDD
jgi:hypothetical protein